MSSSNSYLQFQKESLLKLYRKTEKKNLYETLMKVAIRENVGRYINLLTYIDMDFQKLPLSRCVVSFLKDN